LNVRNRRAKTQHCNQWKPESNVLTLPVEVITTCDGERQALHPPLPSLNPTYPEPTTKGDDPLMNAENARTKHVRTHLKFDLHNCLYNSRHGERRNTKEKPHKGAVGEGGRYKM
jgi:hypothetical protein